MGLKSVAGASGVGIINSLSSGGAYSLPILNASGLRIPSRINVQQIMSLPPSITTGSSSSFGSSQQVAATNGDANFYYINNFQNSRFTYNRFAPSISGQDVVGNNVTYNTSGGKNACSSGVSFWHDGAGFELIFGSNGGNYLIKVDDQYVTLTPQSVNNTGGRFYAYYKFGSTARRRIDVIAYNMAFVGVNIGLTDSLDAAPNRGPKMIVLGDSFTAGNFASGYASNNFVAAFADLTGWDDVWASGVGGEGYVATNGGTTLTYGGRVASDVIAYNPQIVWVVGSVNDDTTAPATVGAAAASLYAQLRTGLPNALIIASPTASSGPNKWTANKLGVKAAVKAAAQAAGVLWLDLLEYPLTGTPLSGIVYTTAAAGLAGSTGIVLQTPGANTGFQPGSIIELDTGTPAITERIEVKSYTFAGAGANYYWNVQFDGSLQYTHTASTSTWKQVGASLWTGHGYQGATAGYGNSDLYVYTDGVHPTNAGHLAIAHAMQSLLQAAINPNG